MAMKFDELIQQYNSDSEIKNRIAAEIKEHIDEFTKKNQLLSTFAHKLTIILHGSTVRNIYEYVLNGIKMNLLKLKLSIIIKE